MKGLGRMAVVMTSTLGGPVATYIQCSAVPVGHGFEVHHVDECHDSYCDAAYQADRLNRHNAHRMESRQQS